jgi:putative ABC transport system ATP-binding protein
MFDLQDVSKRYAHREGDVVALQPTTLRISRGEFVAVVGPSGSGKTTLLSVLGGMLAPSSGKVWLDGQSVYDATVSGRARLRLRKIGFVFQTFNLVPYLSAMENVQVPLLLVHGNAAKFEDRVRELLARVGLETRLHHKPSELSVGQQQRVALARTLVNDPDVILADEPTGNLDPATREHVLDFLASLAAEGRTVVMVTHDPAAAKRAGRVITLADGGVTADSNSRGVVQRVA